MSGLSAKISSWIKTFPSTHLDLFDHVKILQCLKGEGGMVEEVLSWIISLCDLEPSYCQLLKKGDTLSELVKCKPSKIHLTIKNSCQAKHIRPPSWIPETLTGHVQPPSQTCPSSQSFPKLTKNFWLPGRIPEAFLRHVRPQPRHVRSNPISQGLSPGPNISDPQAGFQRGWTDMSGFLATQGCFWLSRKTGLSGFRNWTVQFSWV
jgi:hypothetical protein